MHMSYEMVLTMQLRNLTCRKGRVQLPTRKGGWDLFRRTSDDNSKFTPIKHEPEAPRVRDIMTEEIAPEEYKRAVDPPREMKKSMARLPNQIYGFKN